jgi:protein-disulfide isomerase
MNTNLKLLAAFALGGGLSWVAATQGVLPNASGGVGEDKIKEIVRQVIKDEPKLIIDSVQNMQNTERQEKVAKASEALKDDTIRLALFNNSNSPFIGRADSQKTVVEFFDYNCPACKMQFKALEELHAANPEIKIIFKEFPIFGEVSDKNSAIGLAVHRIAPEKYFEFHSKMMTAEGRADEAATLEIVKSLGMDVEKIKAEAAKPEVKDILTSYRELGNKLHVQGTPTLVIGDEVVPHAASKDDILAKLK